MYNMNIFFIDWFYQGFFSVIKVLLKFEYSYLITKVFHLDYSKPIKLVL